MWVLVGVITMIIAGISLPREKHVKYSAVITLSDYTWEFHIRHEGA